MPELVIKIIFRDFTFPAGPSDPRQPDDCCGRGEGDATAKITSTGGDTHGGNPPPPPYRGE
jgi:hypothetical protein